MKPFFFIHLTDPQLGFFTRNADFALESLLFDRAIAQVNRLRPAFVVITGDFVHDIDNLDQIAEYQRILGRIDAGIPVYSVPGNHEVGNEPTPQTLDRYRTMFGPDRFWFRYNGCWFIGLNSSFLFSPDDAADEAENQALWLNDVLSTARAANSGHCIVLMHHPPCVGSIGEPDTYFNIPRKRRRAFLETLSRHNVGAVFCGHCHRNAICDYKGMQIVATGPIGRPLGEDPPGFRVVKVCPLSIEHDYYGFGEAPETVEMPGC